MNKYNVLLVTTFRKWVDIEAETEEEAKSIASELIEDEDMTDTDDFDTEISEIEEVED